MNKIKELFKKMVDKWKEFSFQKKATILLISVSLVVSIVLVVVFANRTNYATAYYGVSLEDANKIIDTLKTQNIKYKYEDNAILVPADKISDVRLAVAGSGITPSTPKGFEIFDQSKIGLTDTETSIMYQRALEGEIAKDIMSLEGIESASVRLVLPQKSVFARETDKASASVTIKVKNGKVLGEEQVKAIVSLVAYSVENLPKENVQVVDTNMNPLTDGLYDEGDGSVQTNKQIVIKKEYESDLKTKIKEMLLPLYSRDQYSGRENVVVNVTADLDFDTKSVDSVQYDKNPVQRSSKTVDDASKDSNGTSTGASPVDNNMSATITSGTNNSSSTTAHKEVTVNNEISQINEKVVKAQGEVKKLSVSVVINRSDINATESEAIKNIVASACGFSADRGDVINVSALPFNSDYENKLKAEADAYAKQLAASQKQNQLIYYVAAGAGGALLLLIMIMLFGRKRRKRKAAAVASHAPSLDVVIGDEMIGEGEAEMEDGVVKKQGPVYQPVLADEEEIDMSLEKEIKEYATKKPEQVAEVIKSWLAEDER